MKLLLGPTSTSTILADRKSGEKVPIWLKVGFYERASEVYKNWRNRKK